MSYRSITMATSTPPRQLSISSRYGTGLRGRLAGCGLVAALLVLAAPAVRAAGADPALETVLAAYAKAHGGRDAWRQVGSLEISGTQTTFSEPAPFTISITANQLRIDQEMLKQQVSFVFDGQRGWWLFPPFGTSWATRAPEGETAWMRREAGIDLPLLRYRDQGHQLELVGPTTLDGAPVVEIRVVFNDVAPPTPTETGAAGEPAPGSSETWYLDPTTHLPVARRSTMADFGFPGEWMTYWSDYRAVSGGLVLAHQSELEGQTRHLLREVEKVEIGKVDAARFVMPPTPGMAKLATLAGNWSVALELKPHPRAPFQPAVTVPTTIVPDVAGRILVERFVLDRGGILSEVLRTWSYDPTKVVFRVTEVDEVGGLLDVFEGAEGEAGSETAGRIVLLNTPTAGSGPGQSYQRLTLHGITANTFQLDTELSFDETTTWVPMAKATYTRNAP